MNRLIMLCILLTSFYAFSTPIRIVTNDNNPPFSFTLPDKTLTGYYIDFWHLWAKHNQQEIEIYIKPFEESLQDVKNEEVIHSGLFENQERLQWANFSHPFYKIDTGILFNRNYNKSTRLNNLSNVQIAVHSGSYQASYLQKNFKNLDLIYFTDTDTVFNQLFYNEIDAIVAETPFLKSEMAKHRFNGVLILSDEVLMSNQVHAMIAKENKELLEIVNNGLLKIPLFEIIELEKKWLPSTESFYSNDEQIPFLTSEENNWLKNHRNFSLGIDDAWYPFDFTDEKGQLSGISADYISYMSTTLGINFSPEYERKWIDSFELFKQGKIDVMSAIIVTDERQKSIQFTQSYFKAPTAILTRKNSFQVEEMKDLHDKKTGLVKGFALFELVKKDYPNMNLVLVDSIIKGLEDLENGKIDAYIGSLAVANYEIEKGDLKDIKIAAYTPYRLEVSMAVRKGLEPLVSILNKTLNNMNEKQKASIANDWIAVHVETGTDTNTILKWSLPILAVLFLTIFIIARFNKSLQSQITQRIKAEQKLQYLASHDSLTGLPNWRDFEAQFNSARQAGIQQTILFIDLDGFKQVNDSLGHNAGDEVLIETSQRLKKCLQDNGIVSRLGGDEFVTYINNNISKSEIETISKSIIETVSRPFIINNKQVQISASIGISLSSDDATDLQELVNIADKAMYKAKKLGKNNFQFS